MNNIQRIIIKVVIIIFSIESIVMFFLTQLDLSLSTTTEILLDSLFLTLFSSLFIYYWVIKPYILKQEEAESNLQDLYLKLENKVAERTIDLAEALSVAEKANLAKSNFLSNMSHEIRTPMHGILSYANMGLSRAETLSTEKNQKYYGNIKISADRLLNLLNNLLDLSKLEAGKMELNYVSSSLKSIGQRCIAEQQARLDDRKQSISCIPESDDGKGLFDEEKITQVITNLLSNAIKFTAENSIIEFSIKKSRLAINGKEIAAFLFAVKDTGVGIVKGEEKTIFDKFEQGSDAIVGTTKGTGLGLPISKEIIDLHQGKIWAENHSQGGAVFSFIIPSEPPKIDLLKSRKSD